MTNLLAKLEGELNDIPNKRNAVYADQTLSAEKKYLKIAEIELRHKRIQAMINSYILLQNQFLELTGKLSLSY